MRYKNGKEKQLLDDHVSGFFHQCIYLFIIIENHILIILDHFHGSELFRLSLLKLFFS